MSQDLQVVVGPGPRIAGEETQSVQGAVQLAVDLDHSVTSHTKSLFSPFLSLLVNIFVYTTLNKLLLS